MAINKNPPIIKPNKHISVSPPSATPQRKVATNLMNLDLLAMEAFFVELGEQRFRATQLIKWIHQIGVTNFDDMSNIGKALRAKLVDRATITPPVVSQHQKSTDGTHKWLIRMEDGNSVETVFIPDGRRGTLCVSSQVGCALNCSFCSTATQGFNRNLSVAEIIGQVWVAFRELGYQHGGDRIITNVVMMGMGEPLLNFDAVVSAMSLMLEDNAYGLAWKRVTLSTSGIAPQLAQLYHHSPVSVAVSLHAPNDELRDQLVPVNRKYPLQQLLAACRDYLKDTKRRHITFEYVMLAGVNDSPAQAHQLAKLLRGIPAKINLIPFNPYPGARYQPSDSATIERFNMILINHRLVCTTRRTRGEDIAAACGQLVGEFHDRGLRRQRHQRDLIRA